MSRSSSPRRTPIRGRDGTVLYVDFAGTVALGTNEAGGWGARGDAVVAGLLDVGPPVEAGGRTGSAGNDGSKASDGETLTTVGGAAGTVGCSVDADSRAPGFVSVFVGTCAGIVPSDSPKPLPLDMATCPAGVATGFDAADSVGLTEVGLTGVGSAGAELTGVGSAGTGPTDAGLTGVAFIAMGATGAGPTAGGAVGVTIGVGAAGKASATALAGAAAGRVEFGTP